MNLIIKSKHIKTKKKCISPLSPSADMHNTYRVNSTGFADFLEQKSLPQVLEIKRCKSRTTCYTTIEHYLVSFCITMILQLDAQTCSPYDRSSLSQQNHRLLSGHRISRSFLRFLAFWTWITSFFDSLRFPESWRVDLKGSKLNAFVNRKYPKVCSPKSSGESLWRVQQ